MSGKMKKCMLTYINKINIWFLNKSYLRGLKATVLGGYDDHMLRRDSYTMIDPSICIRID